MEGNEIRKVFGEETWVDVPAPEEIGCRMTLRERFTRTMRFEEVDRVPHFEFGYWRETLPAWHAQGLPLEIDSEKKAYAYFGIEDYAMAPVETGLAPAFKEVIVEETAERRVYRDDEGVVREMNKRGHRSIPHFVDFPIKSRDDFGLYRERLDPATCGRYPDNWDSIAAAYRERDFPLGINRGSMIGVVRNWTGFEGLALMTYDDPAFVEEMVEALCQCVEGTLSRAMEDVSFDFAEGWEDICFNSGPIVNPVFFDRIVRPRYERISDLLRRQGCLVSAIDCDGNVMPIAESFLAGGINCMFPVEIRGGTDPRALRDRFGKSVLFLGGVDKHAISKGPEAIDRELERLRPLVEEGGFIPHIDHRCPANVAFADYIYYLTRKRAVLGVGGRNPGE